MDRANYKKGKALPEKVGSMQTFMNGYKGELEWNAFRYDSDATSDASAFLRDYPWPGRAISGKCSGIVIIKTLADQMMSLDTYDDKPHRSGTAAVKKCSNVLGIMCGRIGEDVDDDDYDHMYDQQQRPEYPVGSFSWTPAMQQEFREELEKLIILGRFPRRPCDNRLSLIIRFGMQIILCVCPYHTSYMGRCT